MGKRLIIKGASFITNAIDRITPSTTYYSVIYNLSHCTSSNSATSIAEGSTYQVTISAQAGYTISNVVVRHNGSVVSPTSGYTYRITNVRGNITITATATADITNYNVTYDLENATASNNATIVEAGSSYSVTLTPTSGYTITYASVVHNGVEVTPTSGYTYNIPSVSGNILVECVAEVQTDFNNDLVQGFWNYYGDTTRILISDLFDDADESIPKYICTSKDGQGTAFAFADGEITITIPANCNYRVCMMKNGNGAATGCVSTDIVRSDRQVTSSVVTINCNSIPNMLGLSTDTYPYWGVNIGKADNSVITAADMVALGVNVEETNNDVIVRQGFWLNHSITNSTSDDPVHVNFVVPHRNNGLIPFSDGNYTIKIPVGQYRIILSSTIDGATGTMCRSNVVKLTSSGTTLSSNDLVSLVASNAAPASSALGMDTYNSSVTYLGWAIHYSSGTNSTALTTPLMAITNGLTFIKN